MLRTANSKPKMDVLMKSLEGSREDTKQEVEVPREVHGILAVHVKTVKMVDTEVNESMAKLLQLKLTVCNTLKSFSLQPSSSDPHTAVCDSIKHFSIELPEECDNDQQGNSVLVELMLSSPLLPGLGTTVGKAVLHIHDIIHHSPISGRCELKDLDNGGIYGHLLADWAFCYGNFGYGESYQLSHPVHKPPEYLHYSLFPRLTPPSNRTDHNGLIQNPHPTRHPIFIPFAQMATLCVQESEEALTDAPRYTPELLITQMTRLRLLQQQLKKKVDRRQRLKFLEDQILTRVASSVTPQSAGVTVRKTSLLGRASIHY